MSEPASVFAALTGSAAIGLLGGVHCVGMCGGIAGALSHALPSRRQTRGRLLLAHLQYSAGRIASYCIAGALAGSMGLVAQRLLGPAGGPLLRACAGVLLVGLGLYVSGWWLGLSRLERAGAGIWRWISPVFARLQGGTSGPRRLLLGVLWGWLPCGLVYSMLATAVSSGSPVTGALVMAGFGVGTLPALLSAGSLASELARLAQRRGTRRAAGIAIILFGIWTLGAAGLMAGGGGPHH